MIDLVGHTINKIEFNEDEQTVSLTVDGDKVFLIKVEGDCCSTGKLIGVSDNFCLDLPKKVVGTETRNEKFETDDFYQVYQDTLILENGQKINIVYDNRSNGYYGSSLETYYNGNQLWEFPEPPTNEEK